MSIAYRADIDGLRAVAVLSILVYHASNSLLPGGFIGVDIFFVISGYLISALLLRDLADNRYSIRHFYSRRVRRIFPALLVVLISCLIAGWFLLIPEEYQSLGKHVGGAATFMSNIILRKEAGYFDSIAELKPLLHLWSLGVEEQFYILWPLMLPIGWKFKRAMPWLLGGVVLASLAASILFSPQHPVTSFFLLHTRFWELAAGGMLAWGHSKYPAITRPALREVAGLASAALIVWALMAFDKTETYPSWRALFPVVAALLVIATQGGGLHRYLLGNRLVVGIGRISYPLYLWHWPLLAFARILYWQEPPAVVMAGLMLLATLLAWFTTAIIEKPIRFGRWRKSTVVPYLLALMLCVGLAGKYIQRQHGNFAAREEQNPLFQDLQSHETFRKSQPGCGAGYEALPRCTRSNLNHTPDRVLYGDSHASHLFPGMVLRDRDHSWLLFETSSCPPLMGVRSHQRDLEDSCASANATVLATILAHPELKTVVLSSLGGYYIDGSIALEHRGKYSSENWRLESTVPNEQTLSRAEVFYRGMDRTITALEKAGRRVILVADVPEFDFLPSSCIPRLGSYSASLIKSPCAVERARIEEVQKTYRSVLTKLQANHPGIRLFDTRPLLCDEQWCYAGNQEMLLFHDTNHLSIRGSEKIATELLKEITATPAPRSRK